MLGSSEAVAFLPSQDLERSEQFFAGVLGLEVVSRSAYATVFRLGESSLRVTKVDELRAQPFTVLGWLVADIRPVVVALREQGTVMLRYDGMGQDEEGIWTTPGGDLVAWFHDPDANVLSLTQLGQG